MRKLKFKDLMFVDDKNCVKVVFLRHFYFHIKKRELEKLGKFKIGKNSLDIEKGSVNKFYNLIDKGLEHELKSGITKNKAVYIHKGSDVPLIGSSSFGIVDRGTNLIEVKPVCGCNLKCIYCSVDQERRNIDFVVEKDYLIDELKKVVKIKEHDVEIHIGCNGEPLLYSPLIEFVKDMKSIANVKRISMDTNVTLLTPKIVDRLIAAGLTRFNLSINTMDEKLAKKIAGSPYVLKHAIKIAEYISKKPVSMTIAPVWMDRVNDKDIENLIVFAKKLGAGLGIQNFLKYKFGKTPVKEIPLEKFFSKLKELEKKHDKKLILSSKDYDIHKDNALEKPFKKGDIIEGEIVCEGRLPNETIAVSKDRTISVFDCDNKKKGKKIKIRLLRSKHNIYSGKCL